MEAYLRKVMRRLLVCRLGSSGSSGLFITARQRFCLNVNQVIITCSITSHHLKNFRVGRVKTQTIHLLFFWFLCVLKFTLCLWSLCSMSKHTKPSFHISAFTMPALVVVTRNTPTSKMLNLLAWARNLALFIRNLSKSSSKSKIAETFFLSSSSFFF